MIEITKISVERAMLVALDTKEFSKEVVEEHLAELEELADTAGAETVFKIIQSKSRMDSAYYIGKGKAEELAQLVTASGADGYIRKPFTFREMIERIEAVTVKN